MYLRSSEACPNITKNNRRLFLEPVEFLELCSIFLVNFFHFCKNTPFSSSFFFHGLKKVSFLKLSTSEPSTSDKLNEGDMTYRSPVNFHR